MVRGVLFDLGPYPAMCEGTDWVLGEIWRLPAEAIEATLRVLDEIEGYLPGSSSNLYERIIVKTMLVGTSREAEAESAFTYIMKESRLPTCATKIEPLVCKDLLHQAVASWPVNGTSPEITSKLPDPFLA